MQQLCLGSRQELQRPHRAIARALAKTSSAGIAVTSPLSQAASRRSISAAQAASSSVDAGSFSDSSSASTRRSRSLRGSFLPRRARSAAVSDMTQAPVRNDQSTSRTGKRSALLAGWSMRARPARAVSLSWRRTGVSVPLSSCAANATWRRISARGRRRTRQYATPRCICPVRPTLRGSAIARPVSRSRPDQGRPTRGPSTRGPTPAGHACRSRHAGSGRSPRRRHRCACGSLPRRPGEGPALPSRRPGHSPSRGS